MMATMDRIQESRVFAVTTDINATLQESGFKSDF